MSFRSITITVNASQAGVLAMPEDVFHLRGQSISMMERYVALHVESWYRFFKYTIRPDIQNGDLRVVYGCHKSSGFGIATMENTTSRPSSTELTFIVKNIWTKTQSGQWKKTNSGQKYAWNFTGSADVKVGPSIEETGEVIYPNYGHRHEAPRNQCLFINTVDAKLSDELWKSVEEDGLSMINGIATPSHFGCYRGNRDKQSGLPGKRHQCHAVPGTRQGGASDAEVAVVSLPQVYGYAARH